MPRLRSGPRATYHHRVLRSMKLLIDENLSDKLVTMG
jgi:hypothetical protein